MRRWYEGRQHVGKSCDAHFGGAVRSECDRSASLLLVTWMEDSIKIGIGDAEGSYAEVIPR